MYYGYRFQGHNCGYLHCHDDPSPPFVIELSIDLCDVEWALRPDYDELIANNLKPKSENALMYEAIATKTNNQSRKQTRR